MLLLLLGLVAVNCSGCTVIGYGIGESIDSAWKPAGEADSLVVKQIVKLVTHENVEIVGTIEAVDENWLSVSNPGRKSALKSEPRGNWEIRRSTIRQVWIRGTRGDATAIGVMAGLTLDFLSINYFRRVIDDWSRGE